MRRYTALKSGVTVILLAILLFGCSGATKEVNLAENTSALNENTTGKDPDNKNDPLIKYNRVMDSVNDKAFSWVLRPVAKGYKTVVPEKGRVAVCRFFHNLSFPARLANNLLQTKFSQAGTECMRFGMNSTVGLLGFMDPAADRMNLVPSEEDFGQTLGYYGVGTGPHIVLPLMGHTNVRDAISNFPDAMLNPLSAIDSQGASMVADTVEGVNEASFMADEYDRIKKVSSDFYRFQRDTYEQDRIIQIAQ